MEIGETEANLDEEEWSALLRENTNVSALQLNFSIVIRYYQ